MTETSARLLDAVDTVIAEHGPSGVTLRRVGEAAGLSHTAGAHHFGDKPGLFTAYITRAWNRVADGIDGAATAPDTRRALLDVAKFYAEFAIGHRGEFSVMSRLELANVDAPELWSARERGFFALAELVARLQADGVAAQRDPLDLLATRWGLVHGVTDLWVGGPLWAPYDGSELVDVIERLVAATLDQM